VKPFSLNFLVSQDRRGLRQFLPTIFQYYTIKVKSGAVAISIDFKLIFFTRGSAEHACRQTGLPKLFLSTLFTKINHFYNGAF
jgi:hypothetical protein